VRANFGFAIWIIVARHSIAVPASQHERIYANRIALAYLGVTLGALMGDLFQRDGRPEISSG